MIEGACPSVVRSLSVGLQECSHGWQRLLGLCADAMCAQIWPLAQARATGS